MRAPEDGIIVAVSGGRDYGDRDKVYSVLDGLHKRRTIVLLIQGQCYKGGADKLSEDWAQSREVNCMSVPAKTKKFGFRAAGPIRNKEIGSMKPCVWVLFPGGNGTASAKQCAEDCGAELIEVTYASESH
jgi:hypothetical protein